jgi:hypothetical protein
VPGEVLKINCDPAKRRCSHQPEQKASAAAAQALQMLGAGGCGLEFLDQDRQLVNLRQGPDWYLLSNTSLETACAVPPQDHGGL